jgi:hypothetical protein
MPPAASAPQQGKKPYFLYPSNVAPPMQDKKPADKNRLSAIKFKNS